MKFPITEKTLDTLAKDMHEQDIYGLEKYGKPLNHRDRYDWLAMFRQEMADGLKYIQCEMERKAEIQSLLKKALLSDNPKNYIRKALDLLMIEGTGK